MISSFTHDCGCVFTWKPELHGVRASGYAPGFTCTKHYHSIRTGGQGASSVPSPALAGKEPLLGVSVTHDATNKAAAAASAHAREMDPAHNKDVMAARGAKVEDTKALWLRITEEEVSRVRQLFAQAIEYDNLTGETRDRMATLAADLVRDLSTGQLSEPANKRSEVTQRVTDTSARDEQWANTLMKAFKKSGVHVQEFLYDAANQKYFDSWAEEIVQQAKQNRVLHDNRVKPEQRDQEWRDCIRAALTAFGGQRMEDTKSIELPTAGPAKFAFIDMFTAIYNMGRKEGVAEGVVTGVVNPVLDLCERDRALMADAAQVMIERYEGVISKLDKVK